MTVNATAIEVPTATPYRKLTPSANMPSIAMQTIIPANITARPEVSSDSTIAVLAARGRAAAPGGSG